MPFSSTRAATGLLILIASATLAVAASAQERRPNFDALDANRDGRVTLQEFESYTGGRLMAGNGRMAQKFKEMSPEQQEARLKARFDKLDHGHKGYLLRSDFPGG